jgi:hypothetical protein
VEFDVTVTTTNANPTIGVIADVEVDEDSPMVSVPLTGIGYGNDCVAQEVTVTMTATNENLVTPVLIYTAGSQNGSVNLTFAADKSGAAQVTVTVTDSQGAAVSKTFMVKVNAVNDGPEANGQIPDATVNASYGIKIPVGKYFKDKDDDVLTIDVKTENGNLPGWLKLIGDTISGTPMIADTGCINLVVTATDAAGAKTSQTFTYCVEGYPVSIKELGSGVFEVNMYPNPARDKVNIEFNSSEMNEIQLSVTDITGKLILRRQYGVTNKVIFDMSGKSQGMYFVNIQAGENLVVKKLVVNR